MNGREIKKTLTYVGFDYFIDLPTGVNRCTAARYLKSHFAEIYNYLKRCESLGLIDYEKGKLKLTDKGLKVQEKLLKINQLLK